MVLIATTAVPAGATGISSNGSSRLEKQGAGIEVVAAAAAWELKPPRSGWATEEMGTPTTGSSTASSPGPPSSMLSSEDELEEEVRTPLPPAMAMDEATLVTPKPPMLGLPPTATGGGGIRRAASDDMETEAAASILSSVLPDMAKLSNSLAVAAGAPHAAPHAARAAAARGYEDLLTTLASLASGCQPLDPLHARLAQVSVSEKHASPSLADLAAATRADSAGSGSGSGSGSGMFRPHHRRRSREAEDICSSGQDEEDEEEEDDDSLSAGSGGSWSGGGATAAHRRARMMGRAGGGGRARSASMPEGCDVWSRYASAAPSAAAAPSSHAASPTGGARMGIAPASAAALAAAAAAAAEAASGAGGGPCNPILPHMLAKYADVYNRHGRIGIYTREERGAIIQRFLQKRGRRVWTKKVRYACRKNLADKRIRVKGRFIKLVDPPASSGGGGGAGERLSVIEEGKAMATAAAAEEEEEEGVEELEEQEREQPATGRRMRRHSIAF